MRQAPSSVSTQTGRKKSSGFQFQFQIPLVLLLLVLQAALIFRSAQAQKSQSSSIDSDRESLKLFLQNALPPHAAQRFNLSDSPCRWPGITCSESSDRVETIDLHGIGLRSSIPQGSIGNLDALLYLNLSNNSISGSLPSDILALRQLRQLSLSQNRLSGSFFIPSNGPFALEVLDLSGNQIAGQIPGSIGSLGSLVSLNLSRNELQDSIPEEFFNCTTLRQLDLSFNRLSGEVSPSLGHLTQLRLLALNSNTLKGTLPSEIGRLHYLTSLDLSENRFSGPFPRLDGLRKLELFNISNNFLNGMISAGAFRSPDLRSFSARNNQLVGSLPPPSQKQGNLTVIDLGRNNLSGIISSGIWSMNSLQILRLDENHLTGTLPLQVGPALKELDLRRNELDGQVDTDMQAFQRLVFLDLSWNRLTGRLPELKSSSFPVLAHLGLANNPFADSRFPSIQGMKQIEYLNLSAIRLVGSIPSDIGILHRLQQLDLSHNQLSGSLPPSLGRLDSLKLLDLSYNRLNGPVPKTLGDLKQLQQVNLSYNDLSGDVPAWRFITPAGLLGNRGLCGPVIGIPCPDAPAPRGPFKKNRSRSKSRRRLRVAVIVGIVTGSLAALLCLVAGFFYCRGIPIGKKKQECPKEERYISMSGPFSSEMDPSVWAAGVRDPHNIPVVMFEKPLLNLTFADIIQATANFNKDTQLPDGGGGPVFQGLLPGGIHVAVKILGEGIPSDDMATAAAQLAAIGRLKHPNVVPLLGYCMVGVERLLVYEFVQDGGDVYGRLHELPEGPVNTEDWSTDTWEHGSGEGGAAGGNSSGMPWAVRHRVALGTARALAFLHHGCSPPVVHGDVKASNVLLDGEFDARLAGTGLIQLVEISGGEPGYVAPELQQASTAAGAPREASPKGDVYAFGVVLLELVTGKRPVGDEYTGGNGNNNHGVVQWTRSLIKEKRGFKALDVRVMRGDEDMTEMLEALRVAYLCTAEPPSKRPTMQQVVGLLKDLRPSAATSGELSGPF